MLLNLVWMFMWLYSLVHLKPLDSLSLVTLYLVQASHMEAACLLVRMPYFGGETLGILKEGVEP